MRDQFWESCTLHVLPNRKQDIKSEERGSEPRSASRISERLLTYAINFAFIVLDDIMETELFSVNIDKKIRFFFFLYSFFQRLPDSFPSSLSFRFELWLTHEISS